MKIASYCFTSVSSLRRRGAISPRLRENNDVRGTIPSGGEPPRQGLPSSAGGATQSAFFVYHLVVPTNQRGPEPPERLGPYRLDHLLGSGGMGAVWRAWDERLERWVALKQIRADATLRHGRERLRREARAVARLNHPAIVHVYDILEGADGDWIVMELVEGRTLRCLLDEETALPPARAVRLCREIAEGLAEAHAHGILHRDLKTNNVIVGPSGRAKILDFGLAKEIAREGDPERQELTASTPGVILGTCFAMSPEQVLGRPLDQRSDLFSLGSLLYEMLTGEAPFRAESSTQSLARVLHHEVPPLHVSHPGASAGDLRPRGLAAPEGAAPAP